MFEESFCNSKKTTTNQGPDMTKTYTELLGMMERNSTHEKVLGRTSKLGVGGMVNKGIQSILATSKNTTADGTAEGESDETQAEQEAELSDEDLMLDDL